MKKNKTDICVIGGFGHVGLPLALCFADKGLEVSVYDINEESVKIVNDGVMPFLENGCEKLLKNNMFYKMKIFKILIILTAFITPSKADFNIKAKTAILQDFLSGEILYEKDADLKIFPASMTKIMTSIIAFELIKNVQGSVLILNFCTESFKTPTDKSPFFITSSKFFQIST